jgi:hypothetical protein
VPTDVCNRCHSNTIHPTGAQSTVSRPVADLRSVGNAAPAMTDADRGAELEKQISNLQKRLTALRDSAVISMGLALAFGGFCGLLFGIAGMSLWQRSRAK